MNRGPEGAGGVGVVKARMDNACPPGVGVAIGDWARVGVGVGVGPGVGNFPVGSCVARGCGVLVAEKGVVLFSQLNE